jgi:hypothetical protein
VLPTTGWLGRSSQACAGNDLNGYADDLAAVMETLDLNDVTLVGHWAAGGEVTCYIGGIRQAAEFSGRPYRSTGRIQVGLFGLGLVDAGHAGERSFRDFFRLPPTKEDRRQLVDPPCGALF